MIESMPVGTALRERAKQGPAAPGVSGEVQRALELMALQGTVLFGINPRRNRSTKPSASYLLGLTMRTRREVTGEALPAGL